MLFAVLPLSFRDITKFTLNVIHARSAPGQPVPLRMKMLVVGVLYFAEGVPFGFVYTTLSYYLAAGACPWSRSAS